MYICIICDTASFVVHFLVSPEIGNVLCVVVLILILFSCSLILVVLWLM